MGPKRRWRFASTVALALSIIILGACGRPGVDEEEDPGIVIPSDKTPVNQELHLGFDGEMPDMVVASDGTLHMVYRVVAAPKATLFYVRKTPGDNIWSQPVEVPGSGNSSYRWFAFPDIAVGPDNRVHIIWTPEPYDHNSLFYTSCATCDGSDWSGGQDDLRFRRLTDDLVEFFEICVAPSNTVHITATQLYRRRPTGGFDETDQMVHYFSPDGGKTWDSQQILKLAFEDLTLKCNGENLDLMMRFKELRHSRLVPDASGNRQWTSRSLRWRGDSLSELNPFYNAEGQMTSFVYGAWNDDGPHTVYHSILGGEEPRYELLSTMGARRPNNLLAEENRDGERAAVWADNDAYLHWSGFSDGAWRPDQLMQQKIQAAAPDGLGRVACWQYSGGHGWNGRILWPAMTMVEHDGDFHIVYRSTIEFTEVSTTKRGRFHYVRFRPFDDNAP